MKALSLALAVGCATLGFSSCEPADDSSSTSSTAPVITSFFFAPVTMFVNETKNFEVKIKFTDSDADLTSVTVTFTEPSGTVSPPQSVPVQSAGQSSGEITFVFDMSPDAIGDHIMTVTLVDAAGQSSASSSKTLEVKGFENVKDVCGAQAVTCQDSEFCYNIDTSTCEYLSEHGLSEAGCDSQVDGAAPTCVSSLENPAAEYAEESQCGFVQWWSNPTSLYADCRCGTSAVDVLPCKRPQDLPVNVKFAEGPRIFDVSGGGFHDLGQGPVIGREWFLPTDWNNGTKQDQAMIWAVNLDTGVRRHVSGAHVDVTQGTTEVGSGEPLKEVYHLVAGPGDELFAVGGKETLSPPMIWKVDKTSGNRELVYDYDAVSEDLQCSNGNLKESGSKIVQLHSGSLAIDDEGHYYLASTGTNTPGPAIVKIDKDTHQCEYVTAVIPTNSLNSFDGNIGGGYDNIQFPFRGLLWNAGKLYAISDTNFLEVDPADGKRALVSRARASGGLGVGPVANEGMGNFWSLWDPHHKMFWTVGGNIVVAIVPETGDRYAMPCWHPGTGLRGGLCDTTGRFVPGALERGGMVIDPDDPRHIYFAHDNTAIVKYDTQTANAVIWSR